MGNSSSTPSSSTTTTNGEQYDVFISFRGEDTRNGFTSHLYQALHEKQIKTFIDNQLKRGEEISGGLWSAIGESKISVIIFSENYASSKWCLRELAEIMKYREMKEQIVIPVFYKVDPSHVGKQIGSYEAAFAKHKNELQQEDVVKKWRDALTKASKISGFHSSNARPESEFVRDIVTDIWNKLNNISPSCDFKGLVGIEKHIERVVSLLCLEAPDSRIIGIWGMGGMGKTTIADAVFQLVSHQFEKRTHFAPCVRAESEKDSNGLIRLRDEILSKVLNIENLKSGGPSIHPWIKRLLKQKKVLIVLDDVDKFTEWEILAGGLDDDDGLALGSRIILTTRDKQVLRNCGVEDHNMYNVEGLNDDEGLQLFCKHAFKQNHPTEDLEVLSREVVKIATNVPLAVKVLGSLLYKKSKRDWENAVEKFQRNVHHRVLDVLRISYDGLDEEEKGLFLDLACFVEFDFIIEEEDLELNLISDRGFSLIGLIDKSLVIVERGSIKMHDLLREMGREIVDKESPNKSGIRSRLWREDVLHTLKHNDGTEAVQGISLSMFNLKDVQLGSQVLMKMYNLRTLIIQMFGDQVHLCNGGLDYLPEKLKYLYLKSYPLEVLPSSFNPENLVELDLSWSQIKQLWEGSTWVPKLKWLRLDYCNNLISIPDLSNIPSAEIINLNDCRSLIEIHSSRECPKNLHSLQLERCERLSRLPSNIHLSEEPSFSTSVVLHSSREGSKFSLRGCFRLTKFPHISGNIKSLDLSWSRVEEVPSTIESLSKLERLNMANCENLKRISESICKLKSLDRLDLSECCKLESFPDILEGMELKYLDLSGTAIKELPPSIGNLSRLEELVLSDSILKKLLTLSGLCSLTVLKLDDSNLTEISEDIGCLSSLEVLDLRHNSNLGKLPKSIKKLSKLYHLRISYCDMLRSLPELPSSLRYLEAMGCEELIQSLPDEYEIELCADGCGSFIFNFMNCLKLNHKAVRNLFRDSVLKIKLMGTEKIISLFKVISPLPLSPSRFCSINTRTDKEVKVGIFLPGSKIPGWFSCYKNKGSSINIPGLRNDCVRSSYIMGFEVCLVIGFEDNLLDTFISNIDVYYDFHIETSDGHKEGFVRNSIQLAGMRFLCLDHILLGYNLSRKCYEFFQELDTLLANRGMSDYVGTSFEFNIRSTDRWGHCTDFEHFDFETKCKVKYCGIQPIYISGCNDTAEETCEPYPKGICTEAKDFEGFIDDNSNFNSNNNNNCKEKAIEVLDLELHIGHSSFYDAHMNSVSINQNTGDTSGCNDTVEETCEPYPKGICTEAKDFEGFIDDNSNFNSNNNNNCKETAIEVLDLELHIGHSSFYDAHMNSVSINQNTGDTSGCNDTAEETCEPHPKGICTEAKDFEGFIDDNSNFNSNNNNNCKETAIEDLDLELHIGHSSFYDAHMNSVSINQNTGDTSGCNDTAEETCEPHLKRICI